MPIGLHERSGDSLASHLLGQVGFYDSRCLPRVAIAFFEQCRAFSNELSV